VFEQRYVHDELLTTIGSRLGVTQARVCQIHRELVAHLASRLANPGAA
jgi:DNA-directed RNA polymerase specialized sigma subunit